MIGFHLRAGELEWNELNVVDVVPDLQPDQPDAVLRGETYISIYSPVNAHYPLGSVQPFATLRGEYGGNYGNGSEAGGASIVQTGNWFDAEAYVPVWSSQLYVSEWMQRAQPAPLTLSVSRRGAGWSVTVENKTDRNLPDARLVLGQRLYRSGRAAAAPGQDPHSGHGQRHGADQLPQSILRAVQPGREQPESKFRQQRRGHRQRHRRARWRPPSWAG